MASMRAVSGGRNTGRGGKVVWGVQIILALLFLFAGGMKLAMPAAVLAHLSGLPGGFLKFIGAAECSGALGLLLPGLLGIQRRLTPLAAVGLVTIMSGAVVVTLQTPQPAGAVVPLVVGCLAVYVARRRWDWIAPRASNAAPAAGASTAVSAAVRAAAA
jgi:DoxX-like family